ncbi:MAG TPA: hypothetical protein VD932_03655 [Aquabacterium sp.]|nr:hypothetical protein [Aquabacterium sp.]
MVSEDSRQWISLRGHYVAGFLPVSGGALNQPNAFLEAMQLIDMWVSKDGK